MEAHSADPIARASVCAGPFQKVLWGRYKRSRTPRPGSDRDAPLPGPAARPRMHPNPAPRRKPAPQRPVSVRLAAPKLPDRAHDNAGARKNSMDATTQEPTATSIELAPRTLLSEEFSRRWDRLAAAAWNNEGEQRVFRENSRAAHGPNEGRPTPLYVI